MTIPRGERHYLQVGVTGGIGSGKSTVCRLFAQKGRTVISADEIARELTERDPAVSSAIRDVFGEKVFAKDGSLERKKLAKVVFADANMLRTLDSIVHPRVFEAINTRISSLREAELQPYILIEAALIYESGMDSRLDYAIVVSADETNCIARVMERDGLSEEEVKRRIGSQMAMEQKRGLADFVIDNNGSPEALIHKVDFLDTLLSAIKSEIQQ